jgi:methylase of polypeptide subunit release factors
MIVWVGLHRASTRSVLIFGANPADMMHHLFLLTLDGHQCLCPKDAGANRVMDMGTGTGIWAIDYGESRDL